MPLASAMRLEHAAGGSALALAFIAYFQSFGYFSVGEAVSPVLAGCALAATAAESLPVSDTLDDNLTVPVVAAATGAVLLSTL